MSWMLTMTMTMTFLWSNKLFLVTKQSKLRLFVTIVTYLNCTLQTSINWLIIEFRSGTLNCVFRWNYVKKIILIFSDVNTEILEILRNLILQFNKIYNNVFLKGLPWTLELTCFYPLVAIYMMYAIFLYNHLSAWINNEMHE